MTIRQPSTLLAIATLTAGGDSDIASSIASFLQQRLSRLIHSAQ